MSFKINNRMHLKSKCVKAVLTLYNTLYERVITLEEKGNSNKLSGNPSILFSFWMYNNAEQTLIVIFFNFFLKPFNKENFKINFREDKPCKN